MASPESTEKYFKRLSSREIPEHAIRTLGRTDFRVGSIGFGGYRVHHDSIEHARALRYALLNGFNLIDTSSNYADGGSEILIGNLLQEMIDRKEIQREEIVVVSKVGYVQGQNMKLAQEQESWGKPFPQMVKYMDGCWHCIHPDFLQGQLNRTLERLQVSYVDVYLLHNPEYFLSNAKKQPEPDLEHARSEYYQRIQIAFEWMEERVAEGRIKSYGISSNTFPSPAADFEFTALEKVQAIAEFVASNNYFQVIQFPFNLYEIGASSEPNQADGTRTLLHFAVQSRIATLANRPLNASTKTGMVRLASFRRTAPDETERAFKKQLGSLAALEQQFENELIAKVPPDVPAENLKNVFSLSHQLSNGLSAFQNWAHWDHVRQNIVLPQTYAYLNYLDRKMKEDVRWREWSGLYARTLNEFLDTLSRKYEYAAHGRSEEISRTLENLDAELLSSETLSQQTLRVLTSVPGIDCVLLGMRKTPYVEDAISASKSPSISNAEALLNKFNEQS